MSKYEALHLDEVLIKRLLLPLKADERRDGVRKLAVLGAPFPVWDGR